MPDVVEDTKVKALPEPEVETPEEVAEIFEPMKAEKLWIVSDAAFVPEGQSRDVVYQQNVMGAFQKLEFFGLLTEAMTRAMQGPAGLSISEVIAGLPEDIEEYMDGTKEPKELLRHLVQGTTLDTMGGSLLAVASQIPSLVEDAVLIILGVPRRERGWAHGVITSSPAKGGWTDDEFEECASIFIDQNADVVLDFFKERGPRLLRRWKHSQKIRSLATETASHLSRPSKRSRQTTGSR